MKYEMLNEELGIAACSTEDLTMDIVQNLLSQWKPDTKIGMIPLFYDETSGILVLIRDNKSYNEYVRISESYLGASIETRQEIRENCVIPDIEETINVLEHCVLCRSIEKELYKARKNIIDEDSRGVLLSLVTGGKELKIAYTAFNYGVMQGKRMERAKRKGN